MRKWLLYVTVVGFAVYWASNLLLWYPWSYSTTLGMTLMLTVSPVLWLYATFLCVKTYPKAHLWEGATYIALILLALAIGMDYVFFGIIRDAMTELYHPTTLYGYGFVLSLPFIVILAFRRKVSHTTKVLTRKDFWKPAITGILCFITIVLIIVFE
jgi:hypothetical protein